MKQTGDGYGEMDLLLSVCVVFFMCFSFEDQYLNLKLLILFLDIFV